MEGQNEPALKVPGPVKISTKPRNGCQALGGALSQQDPVRHSVTSPSWGLRIMLDRKEDLPKTLP